MDALSDEVHRDLGVGLFNRCWDLIDAENRTLDDDTEMLLAAMTSRWHWQQVGGPAEVAGGDWQVAHVAGLLGLADLARRFAERNLAIAQDEEWDGWRLASAHEGMARACAVSGDAVGRERHVAAARVALDHESDAEDRQFILDQIDTVPPVP